MTTEHGLFAPYRPLWTGGSPEEPGSAPEPQGGQGGNQSTREEGESTILRGLQRLIDRQGSPDRAAELLYSENQGYRARIRELEGQRIPEGAEVLQGDTLTQYRAYRELGDDPTALLQELNEGRAAREREHARQVAAPVGANPTVLAERLRLSGLRAELRDTATQGSTPATQVVHVLDAQGADLGELRAYADANWGDYLPSLFPQQARPAGTVVVPQSGTNAGTPASIARQYLERQEQTSNYADPLRPKAT